MSDTSLSTRSEFLQLDGFKMQPIEPSSLPRLAAIWSAPDVTRLLPSRGKPISRSITEKSIRSFVEHWQSKGYGVWGVIENDTDFMVGYCGLRYLEEIDETEVLYGLDKAYWGRGIATQAAIAAVTYGFAHTNLQRIVGLSFPENAASRRVMEKAGLLYEKRIRVFGLDAVCYATERRTNAAKTDYERNYKKTVIDFFDGRTRYDNDVTVRRALPLLETVTLKPGQQVLDAATGTGIIAIAVAQAVGSTGSVIGVDFSAGMLQQARDKAQTLGLQNIKWIEADADYLDFEAERFDAIFCSSAIVYFKDIEKTLQSWHHWLRSEGVAVFSGWSEQSYPAPWIIESCERCGIELKNINTPTGTAERCTKLMQAAGFEEVAVEQQQLGTYRTVEQLSGWNGSWFHPHENPLSKVSEEQLQQVIADYHNSLKSKVTEAGVWCESLAYYVSGKKR